MSSRRTNLEIPEIEENLHSTSTTNTRNTTNDNEDNDVSTNNTNGSLNTTTTTVTLYSQVNHNEIETDPLLKRLYDSVDAMLRDQTLSQRNTQDNIVSKLFYVVMTAIEKNLSDQDSPFTRNSTVDERLRNMFNTQRNNRISLTLNLLLSQSQRQQQQQQQQQATSSSSSLSVPLTLTTQNIQNDNNNNNNNNNDIPSPPWYSPSPLSSSPLSSPSPSSSSSSSSSSSFYNRGNYSSFSSWINDSNLLPPTPSDLDIDDISLIDHAQNIYLKELEINQPTWFAAGSYT